MTYRSLTQTLSTLPPPATESHRPAIRAAIASNPGRAVVVLDDDPTGTQTVHDIPVLTTWSTAALAAEFGNGSQCFFVLTNSRSLSPAAAVALNQELARNLIAAAGRRKFTVISRSDSTLRGHFPVETDALDEVLGPFDATILVPYFEAGKRYTIDDVHYVAEGDALIPVAETPFARDASFGYSSSNLREWVQEKTAGRVPAGEVRAIAIAELRGEVENVCARLMSLPRGAICAVNACHPRDVEQLALATLLAERAGRQFLFRSAAEFVAARIGLDPRPLLTTAELKLPPEGGALIVAGSYVPKTTEQLARLFATAGLERVELSVEALRAPEFRSEEIARAERAMNTTLADGRDVAVFTSRQVVTGRNAAASLEIGADISTALVTLIRGLVVRPRYLVAKGGITSSDLATRGLGVKRAIVLGQLLPGVPVWRAGNETMFPGLCYVVFPGNVGSADALLELHSALSV
jgi:uncharacterized protein YgbK (DUF1537 family)